MIQPPFLKPGDKIRIISTARKIDLSYIEYAEKILKEWGLIVELGSHLFDVSNQFAGTDTHRATDLQDAIDDPEIKAIFCARGGYGTLRIMDKISYDNLKVHPKWLIGYSDITALHSHFQQTLGIKSLHATMPINFKSNTQEALLSLKKALFGENLSYKYASMKSNRTGEAEGILIGGNLSMLYSLNGSISFPDTKGKILYIEDLDEYLYHLDRMMLNLKRSGALKSLTGLIVGGMTGMHDNEVPFGKDATEIIYDAVSEYDFPVCFDFPAGHIDDNKSLILGAKVRLKVASDLTELDFLS